ncbi:MAG: peptidase U32 family protein [archaeon]|nr:peptidase U32 family protein [archaeon]
MENNDKIELLSPAGSLPSLKAAIAGGADAVYFGMNKFNARENAVNFNEDYLKIALNLLKSNNVRAYLTMNASIKNSEIDNFFKQMEYAYLNGIDAVIIQDPAFIEIIKSSFRNLEVHISTQTGITNSLQAGLYSDAYSINLARELSKENIESIRKNFKKQLEIFVQGALCVCVSGSCLFSSLLGGRSGNRGKCAQPCRKLYNNSYLLSTKDLCLVDKIPEIIKLGINSIKIEGRMRTPFYVNTTTRVYRKAIDSYYSGKFKITQEMRKDLDDSFSREFTQGKFSGEDIFNTKRASGTSDVKKIEYKPKIKEIKLEKRESNLQIPDIKDKPSSGKKLITRVYDKKQALIAEKYSDILLMDMFNPDFDNVKKIISKPLYAVTPRIIFDSDSDKIKKKLKEIEPDGIFAGNMGVISMNLGLPIILDYNCNCYNDFNLNYLENLQTQPIISIELSSKELEEFKNKDFIVLVHGKIRLMTLAHELKEKEIADDKGFNFHVNKIYNGIEIINEKEIGLFNKTRNLLRAGINQLYIDTDVVDNFEEIMKAYRDILEGKTIDSSKIEKNYVLGWSKQGVL